MNIRHHCPICESNKVSLLHRLWQNRNSLKSFIIQNTRYLAVCDTCGTIFRFPLIIFDDTNEYGKEYYEISDIETEQYIEAHVAHHQQYNYDNVIALMGSICPPQRFPRWLDVGSVGYPTLSKDYDFHTIEPSQKAVDKGKELFDPKKIFQGTIDTYSPSVTYDGILFNNSLYCHPEPHDSLIKCRDLLSNEGMIVVTLGTYLNGARQDPNDGNADKIEDLLPGDTLHVYYNDHSLRYLFESSGFEFIESHTISAYGCKDMVVYFFKKVDMEAAPERELLDRAKSYMWERLEAAFERFETETYTTLESINQKNVVLYGETELIKELNEIHSLTDIHGIIMTDLDAPAGFMIDGLAVTSIENIRSMLAEGVRLKIVVTSFAIANDLAANVASQLGYLDYEIYVPTRFSAMKSMWFRFADSTRMSKCFKLNKITQSA